MSIGAMVLCNVVFYIVYNYGDSCNKISKDIPYSVKFAKFCELHGTCICKNFSHKI